MASERFSREAAAPILTEAPPVSPAETGFPTSDLLTRLERQAAECGRLEARVEALERAVRTERDARRKLSEALRREREAAAILKERAELAETGLTTARADVERLQSGLAASEEQAMFTFTQMKHLEQLLAWKSRPVWRKLLRRPPA